MPICCICDFACDGSLLKFRSQRVKEIISHSLIPRDDSGDIALCLYCQRLACFAAGHNRPDSVDGFMRLLIKKVKRASYYSAMGNAYNKNKTQKIKPLVSNRDKRLNAQKMKKRREKAAIKSTHE